MFRTSATDERRALGAAQELAKVARSHPAVREGMIVALGPAPSPISRLRTRFRFQFLLRGEDRSAMRQIAQALAQRIDRGLGNVRAHLDVDPVSML